MNDSMMRVIHGVTFLLVRDGCVLLERCPKKRDVLGVGEWFVPGGKIEGDEPESKTLVREMEEELGVSPSNWHRMPIIEGSPINPQRNRGVFLMRPFAVVQWHGQVPDQTLDEGVPLRWVHFDEAVQSPVPQVRAMVAMAIGYAYAWGREPVRAQ